MKRLYYLSTTTLLLLISVTSSMGQNIRFSFERMDISSTVTEVNIYAQTTSGTENLTGYTTYLYYDNTETTLTNLESSPTTGTPGLGWGAPNQTSILFQSENNANVGITHTGYFFYQNFDNAFTGNNITTTPTLLLTLTFDHTVGTAASGSAWLAETDEVPPMQYVDNLFNSYDVITMGVQSQILPVELVSFEADREKENVRLNWTTASEVNASHFEVEHSEDGVHFETIEIVVAKGRRAHLTDYDLLHKEPSTGYNYYRLKMVDRDNSSEYSSIRVVKFDGLELTVSAPYPNPTVDGRATLEVWAPGASEGVLRIYDILGRVVEERSTTLYSGTNQLALELEQLVGGTYWIQLAVAGKRYSQALIIEKE